jgi:hypothetical protein
MRQTLERSIQDAEHRRARLERVAAAMLRSRGSADFAAWLVQQLRDALGASTCAMALKDSEWRPWLVAGGAASEPPMAALAGLAPGAAEPIAVGPGLLVPLPGIAGVVAAVWIETTPPVDESSRALLAAIGGTAGVIIEQATANDFLGRDPATGLLTEGMFTQRARERLRGRGYDGRVAALVAMRVVGLEQIRATQGSRAAQAAVAALAFAAREGLATDDLGLWHDHVVVLFVDLNVDDADREVSERTQTVGGLLRQQTAAAGPPLALASSWVPVHRSSIDVTATLERVCRELGSAVAGASLRIGE